MTLDKTATTFAQEILSRIEELTVHIVDRTGDLARYNENGNLEFCGRIDFQVKLRGFRIELGEIENRAANFPEIIHAIAEVKKNTLVLYYTSAKIIDEAALKNFMAKALTDYMVPSIFVRPICQIKCNMLENYEFFYLLHLDCTFKKTKEK